MSKYEPSISESIRVPVTLISFCWLVMLLEKATNSDFSYWGIFPQTMRGFVGILFSPFIHGNFQHLLSNSPSFIILGTSIILFYPKIAHKIYLYIYFFTGLGVWLFAREAYHIGASGMIYGFAGFLFFSGLFRKDTKSLAISLSVAILFNGMVYGIFPQKQGISWESHLIGALIGGVCAYYMRMRNATSEEEQKILFDYPFEGYYNIENDSIKYIFKEKDENLVEL